MVVGRGAAGAAGSLPSGMARRIVVFGAPGYSGRLIAERLVASGVSPVLAGRSEARLSERAARLGGRGGARADALRADGVFARVGPRDVLISTVGPYVKYATAAVRAAIAAGCLYIDT